MKKVRLLAFASLVACLLVILGFSRSQDGQVTRTQLRELLSELGYEVSDIVKDEGKEKYAVPFTKNADATSTFVWHLALPINNDSLVFNAAP